MIGGNIQKNPPYAQQRTNVYEIACDFCGDVRSRRHGLCAVVKGRNRFLCAQCAERAGAAHYSDTFGDPDFSVRNLIAEGIG